MDQWCHLQADGGPFYENCESMIRTLRPFPILCREAQVFFGNPVTLAGCFLCWSGCVWHFQQLFGQILICNSCNWWIENLFKPVSTPIAASIKILGIFFDTIHQKKEYRKRNSQQLFKKRPAPVTFALVTLDRLESGRHYGTIARLPIQHRHRDTVLSTSRPNIHLAQMKVNHFSIAYFNINWPKLGHLNTIFFHFKHKMNSVSLNNHLIVQEPKRSMVWMA